MIDKDAEVLEQILNKILKSSPGVKYCVLMDRTGFTISYSAKFVSSNNSLPIDRLGAIGGAIFSACEEQGDCVDFGDIKSLAVGYKNGFIFSLLAGEGILSVITDKKINQGLISNIMKKYRGIIANTLNSYLQQDKSFEINEELKAILNENDISNNN
ncbi:MAG: roadblock/LC7 domain-containing protein [Promethearchaeota archaeon]